jgi:integrase/recombinase XerD
MTEIAITLPSTMILKDDWRQALDLFFASRNTPATRRAYAAAIQDLLTVTGRLPWEVTRTDVMRWVQGLKGRGLAPCTIANRLAGVSAFYRFCMEEYLVAAEGGREIPLHAYNPAAGKSLRPRIEMYGKSTWLSPEESKALLRAIIAPGASQADALARRNFALVLGYILLARRNSEWRVARWGDFENRLGRVEYRWAGKGKQDQRIEVPAPVWNAVIEFLREAGRLETIQAGEYIFTALKKNLRMPGGRVLDHATALSAREVGRLLKRYCRLAGLDAKAIHPHTLRHTGAMLRREVGASIEEIMAFLGHSNLGVTSIYLHQLEGKSDQSWGSVADLLGIDKVEQTLYKGSKKGQKSSDNSSYRTMGGEKPDSEGGK